MSNLDVYESLFIRSSLGLFSDMVRFPTFVSLKNTITSHVGSFIYAPGSIGSPP